MLSLKNVLIKISGNGFVQRWLEKNVNISQYFMGIGSGSDVVFSGERAVFDILKRRMGSSCCIFDVGANKGQFLQVVLENLVVGKYMVHCFEPGHETFKALVDSFQMNGHVVLNNIGLSKEGGEALLHYDDFCSGLASLTKRKLDHFNIDFAKSEMVKISTIDNYCEENQIDHIHLLKIDIEGHEYDALLGAEKMFALNAIDIVTFEFGGCNIDTRTFFQDFWYFFSEKGFKLFRITPSGYLHPINSYKEIHEQFRTANFMAVANNLDGIEVNE